MIWGNEPKYFIKRQLYVIVFQIIGDLDTRIWKIGWNKVFRILDHELIFAVSVRIRTKLLVA